MAKQKGKDNPYFPHFPGKHLHEDFDHVVSPLGRDGAETPSFSPDECIDYKIPSNQRQDGPHDAGDVGDGRPEGGGGGYRRRGPESARNYRRGG